MEFLTALPERDNQICFQQQGEVLGHTLAGHVEMAAKLAQGLPIALVELIEQ